MTGDIPSSNMSKESARCLPWKSQYPDECCLSELTDTHIQDFGDWGRTCAANKGTGRPVRARLGRKVYTSYRASSSDSTYWALPGDPGMGRNQDQYRRYTTEQLDIFWEDRRNAKVRAESRAPSKGAGRQSGFKQVPTAHLSDVQDNI